MIVCPNCSKENADDSAHCGFCGNQLTEGGKKTMFGMAALSADQIRAAAEAAKQKAASEAPSLNLPKPGQSSASNLPQPGSLPDTDAFAKTEMMPSVSSMAQADAKPDPFADEFAALESQYGNDADFGGPVDPSPSFSSTESVTAPTPAVSPTPSHQQAAPQQPQRSPQAFGAPNQQGPAAQFGNSPGPQQSMQKAPGKAMQTGGADNKKKIIIAVVVAAVLSGGCIIVAAIAIFMSKAG